MQNKKRLIRLIDWMVLYIQWQLYFMYIQDESILMNDDVEPCFVLDRHAEPDFNVLAHKINSPQEDMPLYPYTLFRLWADQSFLLLLNAACLAKKKQTPILMSLVWPDRGSNPRPSALEAGTLTITLPRWSVTDKETTCKFSLTTTSIKLRPI